MKGLFLEIARNNLAYLNKYLFKTAPSNRFFIFTLKERLSPLTKSTLSSEETNSSPASIDSINPPPPPPAPPAPPPPPPPPVPALVDVEVEVVVVVTVEVSILVKLLTVTATESEKIKSKLFKSVLEALTPLAFKTTVLTPVLALSGILTSITVSTLSPLAKLL